jgi:hypothetical protein
MVYLEQIEADALLAVPKLILAEPTIALPAVGKRDVHKLQSCDGGEDFLLDVQHASIAVKKVTYQMRARNVVTLARLDFGRLHTNPDGAPIGDPHLHVYRAGYHDKWAFEPDSAQFGNLTDLIASFKDFLIYCHVSNPPEMLRSLFS